MKTKMEQLRADLMKKGVFRRYERRQIQYLTKANHAQRQIVQNALPAKHMLRGWMESCGEVDGHGNIDYCGVPLCPRCHMRERAVQTGKAIKKIFTGASNEELAFATILLPPQLDFSGMTKLVEDEKRRLRTFIDRQRKKDDRWDDFQLLGWWEIDRMSFGDFESSGRNTRIALEALGFPIMEAADKTIWRPHLHAIVRKGRLTAQEVASALRKETYAAKYQVDIQPFRTNRDVGDNIQNIVRYCLKFRIERDYKRPDAQDFIEAEETDNASLIDRNWWPAEDILAYAEWLCVERSGFQSLRVLIGQAKDKNAGNEQNVVSADMPIVSNKKDGDRSLNAISDRFVVKDMNGILVVEDSRVVSMGYVSDMYNNTIQDTNWTDAAWPAPHDGPHFDGALVAVSKTSTYAGNVISLKEHLRNIRNSVRADGAPLELTKQ